MYALFSRYSPSGALTIFQIKAEDEVGNEVVEAVSPKVCVLQPLFVCSGGSRRCSWKKSRIIIEFCVILGRSQTIRMSLYAS